MTTHRSAAALAFGLRAAIAGLAGLATQAPAFAQESQDVTPPSAAQSLACLKRPDELPEFPSRPRNTRQQALVRVKLRFNAADAPPEVEILANTMREDQLDVVQRYVKRYRLPCLQTADGSVQAVQEFSYTNSELAPLPLPAERRGESMACIVQPADPVHIRQFRPSRRIEHVVLTMSFASAGPGGSAAPEIKVLYTDASDDVVQGVSEWAARSRMPCLTGETPAAQGPVVLRQSYTFKPHGYAAYSFKDARLTLMQFLAMAKDRESMKADFDFHTMNCPFKVNYTIYGPRLPNEVHAGRPLDPNRLPFMRWLAKRDLDFKSDRMANDLFGTTVQIDVPCGKLALGEEPAEATTTGPTATPATATP